MDGHSLTIQDVIPDCSLRTKMQADTTGVVAFSLDSQGKFPYAPSTKKQFLFTKL